MQTIGERIKKRRKELAISVEELARAAELRPTTLYDLERGNSRSTTKLHLIAAKLRVDVHWLEHGGTMQAVPAIVSALPATVHGYAISPEAARLAAEWEKLEEPARSQIQTMIESLVAAQVRSKRAKSTRPTASATTRP